MVPLSEEPGIDQKTNRVFHLFIMELLKLQINLIGRRELISSYERLSNFPSLLKKHVQLSMFEMIHRFFDCRPQNRKTSGYIDSKICGDNPGSFTISAHSVDSLALYIHFSNAYLFCHS